MSEPLDPNPGIDDDDDVEAMELRPREPADDDEDVEAHGWYTG